MTQGQLFGGIFGFGLAAQMAGIENVWYNEKDSYCCDVVRARIKDGSIIDNVTIHEKDIREIGAHNLERVDIVSGGFPCQPFSQAGKRKGTDDDRYLWPEMLRVIREIQPAYVIGENVAGLLSMENGETLKRILSDLENEGYHNEVFSIPACGVGAWHRRERLWIVAHSRLFRSAKYEKQTTRIKQFGQIVSNTPDKGLQGRPGPKGQGKKGQFKVADDSIQGGQYWATEPSVGRVATRIPNRVDRLKGLGNAIVPQVAYEIFKAITEIHNK